MTQGEERQESAKEPLLLHLCCGPCATAVIERLTKQYALQLYWFNPNIQPPEEYARRLAAAKAVALHWALPLQIEEGGEDEFAALAAGFESEPEGGACCARCFELRLRHALQAAREAGIPYVATTLSISPHKSAARINEIGRRLAAEYDLFFLEADFKKEGGFARSVALSKQLGLYRQSYCGCLFSRSAHQDKEASSRP